MKTFALFHPGEMGATLGTALASRGFRVLWASQGRSTQTAVRAKAASLEGVCTIEQAVKAAEVVVSVCPPHAALALARQAAANGFGGIYVDANAISPATAREIGTVIEAAGGTFVDGGMIGLLQSGRFSRCSSRARRAARCWCSRTRVEIFWIACLGNRWN